jgi:ATP-binding cassette subfamily C protein LapB
LFYGTLKENILCEGTNVDDEKLWQVIQSCGLANIVNKSAYGLQQNVGERGCMFSGGQRQAVAIARAIVNSPSIFIMDEPTSSMDTNSEALIKKTIAKAIEGKTLIINTHRTTLLDLVSRVIVIENGKIIADGPKEAVLTQFKSTENVKKRGV